ncbi:hypothetical protein GCM10011375_31770 [Hymenobacter qilianensis]|uniref:Uncharacterized protein n=2 Tax=Hymenobacter qilianensis TaxID=1385715 RepID=A0ACB5PUX2_9BACT|nr:hypothetical protein [Hymenobacter qilianensis]QNP51527.1 hypothetical protein H9L05_16185 [Hymenobacter qilianensis]GGF74357.1 hypothetical protein GCM10011375_31770 [Hymenobacter qilianensis]
MVGLERTILPQLAEQEVHLVARSAILSFIVVFWLTDQSHRNKVSITTVSLTHLITWHFTSPIGPLVWIAIAPIYQVGNG